MSFNKPKDTKKYKWTNHAVEKMQHYGIYPGKVKRIIRNPDRIEEGVVPNTVAVMKKTGNKNIQEMWVMYQLTHKGEGKYNTEKWDGQKIRIITAWRYPGETSEKDPVPEEIISEIQSIL